MHNFGLVFVNLFTWFLLLAANAFKCHQDNAFYINPNIFVIVSFTEVLHVFSLNFYFRENPNIFLIVSFTSVLQLFSLNFYFGENPNIFFIVSFTSVLQLFSLNFNFREKT